jgi:Polyketide cyclase / dehydrase and lipid transport
VPSFESTIDLPASPEASWSFVVEHGAEIESFVFEPQGGVQGAGTLNTLTFRLLGLVPVRGVSRTVAWQPPSRCEFESVKPAWPVHTFIRETFEPADGATRHVIRYDVRPVGRVGTLAAPLVCRLMRRNRRRYQQRLRAALDRLDG